MRNQERRAECGELRAEFGELRAEFGEWRVKGAASPLTDVLNPHLCLRRIVRMTFLLSSTL